MVDEKQRRVLDQALDKFGGPIQIMIAIEEMAELTKELVKDMRKYPAQENDDNIAEEVADVFIMLEQVMMVFGIEETVKSNINHKIDRLNDRINGKI
jgi:hypothetical protein